MLAQGTPRPLTAWGLAAACFTRAMAALRSSSMTLLPVPSTERPGTLTSGAGLTSWERPEDGGRLCCIGSTRNRLACVSCQPHVEGTKAIASDALWHKTSLACS